MNEKHPIDSFFKDKLAERQYPMKEEYWASASALIEANSARKRRKFLWFFLFLGLLGSTSLIGYWKYALEETSPIGAKELVLGQIESNQTELNQTETKQAADLPIENIELEIPKREKKGLIAEKEQASTLTKNPVVLAKTPQIPEGKIETDSQLEQERQSKSQAAGKGLNQQDPVIKIKEQPVSNSPSKPLAEQAPKSLHGSRVLDALSKELVQNIEPDDLGQALNQTRGKALEAIAFDATISHLAISLLPLNLPSLEAGQIPFIRRNRRHSLGLDFGFALHDAMGSKIEQTQSMGMSPVLGLGYRFQLNRNLSFQSGLRYTQTPSLAGDSTYTSTSFSFGAQVQGTRIRPLTLHQLELPFSLRLQIGARSSLALGGYMRYLLNVRSEVSTFESNPFETSPGPVNKAWGYKQGFKDVDLGLQFAYYYQLSEGLHVGFETQYGLRDLRGNTFYREQNFDRNLNARIVLRYDFVRF